jgi:hypothetical protein
VIVTEVQPKQKPKSVLSRVWFFGFSCGVSYIFNAVMFPLFITQVPNWNLVKTQGKRTNDMLNLLVLTVNIFCDFFGRVLAAFKWVRKLNIKHIISLCYVRIALVVLLVLFNFPQFHANVTPVLCSDVLFYITVILFSTTTTIVSTSGYTRYQDLVQTDAEKLKGSYIVNLFMQSGLFVGGVMSMVLMSLFEK